MPSNEEQLIDYTQMGRITVATVRASSVLSALNVVEFGNEVLERVRNKPGINLLLNFTHVDYLSSAVLTELLRLNKAVEQVGGRMRLCGISPTIREVFEITNLDKLFALHEEGVENSVKRFERALDVQAQEAAWNDDEENA
ncbi:MAG: STAS domain-containing protein [Candidatus Hydrogenedentota bacterium]